MAKSQYSADSARPPQPTLPSNGDQMGAFKTAYLPASFFKYALPVPTTFVATGMNAYIGENADLGRRHQEHGSVRRTPGYSGTLPPHSID